MATNDIESTVSDLKARFAAVGCQVFVVQGAAFEEELEGRMSPGPFYVARPDRGLLIAAGMTQESLANFCADLEAEYPSRRDGGSAIAPRAVIADAEASAEERRDTVAVMLENIIYVTEMLQNEDDIRRVHAGIQVLERDLRRVDDLVVNMELPGDGAGAP